MSTWLLGGIRYTADVVGTRQRLTGPLFVVLIALALTEVSGGGMQPTLAETLAWLFPLSAWVTVAVLNADEPSALAIAEAAAGGPLRLRTAGLLLALGLCLGVAVAALVSATVINAGSVTGAAIIAGAIALALVCLAGVTLGSLCARPVVSRAGWAP